MEVGLIEQICMYDAYPTATKKVRRLSRKSKKWHKKRGYTTYWTDDGKVYFTRSLGVIDLVNGSVKFFNMK